MARYKHLPHRFCLSFCEVQELLAERGMTDRHRINPFFYFFPSESLGFRDSGAKLLMGRAEREGSD